MSKDLNLLQLKRKIASLLKVTTCIHIDGKLSALGGLFRDITIIDDKLLHALNREVALIEWIIDGHEDPDFREVEGYVWL